MYKLKRIKKINMKNFIRMPVRKIIFVPDLILYNASF